jgi:FkbM family methyltransferase
MSIARRSMRGVLAVQRDRLTYRAWKLQALLFPGRVGRFTLVDGSVLECPFHTSLARALYMGRMENAEVAFVRQALEPGDVFLDVGANCGLFTVVAARCVGPTGHVFAFEPSPRESRFLRRNIDANRLTNVSVVERAVGDVSGVRKLAISRDGGLNSFAVTSHPEQRVEEWIDVSVTTLDEFVQGQGIESGRIALIKIDVEGAEHLVLAGARELLGRAAGPTGPVSPHASSPTILCEFSDWTSVAFHSSGNELWHRFAALGYVLHSLSPIGRCGDRVELRPAAPAERYRYENLVALRGTPRRAAPGPPG